MKYKVIIFDIGDTLLEYYPSQEQIYVERLKSIGIIVPNEKSNRIRNVINKTSYDQIAKEENGEPRISDEDFGLLLDEAVLLYINENLVSIKINEHLKKLSEQKIPETELRIMPNTIETLNILKKSDLRLGIVSNHRKWMLEFLKKIELINYFESIIISEIAGYEKPDVKIMQAILKELSVDPKMCLYVGDHPFDVLCSKKAGIDCAWLTDKDNILPSSIQFKEDYKIQKLFDLIKILGI
jgi:HAD superfamily hydrolase (TIGR01549 family)